MTIYATSDAEGGVIVRVLRYLTEEFGRAQGPPESGTFDPSNTVFFDESTNPVDSEQLNGSPDEFNVVSGVLHRNGSPVTINPDGPELEYHRNSQDFVIDVTANMGTATLTETKKMVALLLMVVLNKRDF